MMESVIATRLAIILVYFSQRMTAAASMQASSGADESARKVTPTTTATMIQRTGRSL